MVQHTWDNVPVHIKILIVVVTLLFGYDAVTFFIRVSREILTFLFIEIGIERDAAAFQGGVLLQQLSAIRKHHVGLVDMLFNLGNQTVGCGLYLVQMTVGTLHDLL